MPGAGLTAAHDIPRVQQEVFKFDWLAHGCPSLDDFESAVVESPSSGVFQIPE
jgi:hypothetical protein